MKIGLYILIIFAAFQVYQISHLFFPETCQKDAGCISPLYSSTSTLFQLRLYRARQIPRRSVTLESFKEEDKFFEKEILLADGAWEMQQVTVPMYPTTRLNGTISVIVVLVPVEGGIPVISATELTKYKKVTRRSGTFLLGNDTNVQENFADEWVTHWKPSLTIRVVLDDRSYDPYTKPVDVLLNMQGSKSNYLPYMYADELHLLNKHLVPLSNDTTRDDPHIVIKFRPINIGVFRMMRQVEGSIDMMKQMGFGETEIDEVLELMNPDRLYRLAATYTIAFLHMIFSYLAFKNEIGFWKNRETIEGLSATSVIGNAICTTIIFLFLVDNDTSYLVLGTVGISLIIDWWKVSKVIKCGKNQGTRAEQETTAHDAQGMKYLSYILTPLVIGWAIYSLLYQTHRSYYSWFISSAANGVYAFGFVLMTPQIFINYKLKSVAHLPWRAMSYKFFNTFVDDVLAFGILDMPTLHRLATLRDDFVFFIFLYQRWIYPVDYSRANEFGFAYEEDKKTK